MLGLQLGTWASRVSYGTLNSCEHLRKPVNTGTLREELSKTQLKSKMLKGRFSSSSARVTTHSRSLCTQADSASREVLGGMRESAGAKKFNWREIPEKTRPLGTFRVASYNVLADSYSEPSPGRVTILKPFVQGRIQLILKDLELLTSDIVCLQEVEAGLVDTHFRHFFHSRGYDYEYCVNPRANDPLTPESWKSRVDGLLIAWRTAKFNKVSINNLELRQMIFEHPNKWGVERKTLQNLLRLDTPISIAMLETTHVRTAKKMLCMANIHGFAGGEHAKPLINVLQTQLALHGIRKIMYQHLGMNAKKVQEDAPAPFPLIFAGDFNMRPGSGSYQLMANGYLPADSTWLTYSPGKQSTTEAMKHHLQLQSAYGASAFGEPNTTYYASPSLNGTLDYLWYTPNSLKVHKLLDTPDFSARSGTKLPSVEYPSDHLPIGAEFSFQTSYSAQQDAEPANNAVTFTQNKYAPKGSDIPRIMVKPKTDTVDPFDDSLPEEKKDIFKPKSSSKKKTKK